MRFDRPIFFIVSLILVFVLAAGYLAQTTSPTTDEVAFHTVNGYLTLKTHDFRMSPASPAWARQFVAIPWLFLNLKLDLKNPDWEKAESVPFAVNFLYHDNRDKADLLITLARFMNIFLGAALLACVWNWSFELYGFKGAIVSGVLTAFTPSLLAHSSLATTDISVTLYSFVFMYSLWKYCCRGGGSRWFCAAAVSLGLAQSSKFTALLLYPILAVLLVQHKGLRRAVSIFCLMTLASMGVVWTTYFFEYKPLLAEVPRLEEKLGYVQAISSRISGGNPAVIERLRQMALYTPVPLPSYILGIAGILRSHQEPYRHFFIGRWTTDTQWFYYLWTFCVKMTPGFLCFLILRIFAMKPRNQGSWRTAEPFLLTPVAALFFVTLFDSTAVGLRYVLVVIPLLSVWMGAVTLTRVWQLKIIRYFVPIFLLVHTGSAVLSFPNSLEYFNFLMGGADNAYHYLRGSDLDWGQGLKGLSRFIRQEGLKEVGLEYFGTADPSYYGVHFREPTKAERLRPGNAVYAVSAQYLEELPWTKGQTPTHRIGQSIFIYDRRGPSP